MLRLVSSPRLDANTAGSQWGTLSHSACNRMQSFGAAVTNAIWDALQPSQGTILKGHREGRPESTACLQPMQVSLDLGRNGHLPCLVKRTSWGQMYPQRTVRWAKAVAGPSPFLLIGAKA